MTKNTEILIVVAIAILLEYLPKIGRVFKGFNTLIHETGHALMTLIFSGEVVSIDIFYSGEGVATTKTKSWWSRFFISIAGYPFASIIAFLFSYLIFRERYNYVLYVMVSIAVVNLIFWVRNPYGLVWLITVISFLFLCFYFDWTIIKRWTALSITSFVFVDAFVSAWYILVLAIKSPKKAGDATNLQKSLWIPAFFWALFFWAQATLLALLSIHLFHPLPYLNLITDIL